MFFPAWTLLWSVAVFKIFLGVYLSFVFFFFFLYTRGREEAERKAGKAKTEEWLYGLCKGGEGKKRGRRRGEKGRDIIARGDWCSPSKGGRGCWRGLWMLLPTSKNKLIGFGSACSHGDVSRRGEVENAKLSKGTVSVSFSSAFTPPLSFSSVFFVLLFCPLLLPLRLIFHHLILLSSCS